MSYGSGEDLCLLVFQEPCHGPCQSEVVQSKGKRDDNLLFLPYSSTLISSVFPFHPLTVLLRDRRDPTLYVQGRWEDLILLFDGE